MTTSLSARAAPQGLRYPALTGLLLSTLLALSGCGNWPPTPVEQGRTQPRLAERPQEADTVRGAGEPAVVTLPIAGNFKDRLATQGDPLPHDIVVPKTNFSGVPVTTALQAVLNRADISLSMDEDYGSRQVNILNLSGPLDEVVERICDAGRLYCRYHNGSIQLSETETFIIEMPPIPTDAQNSIADAIGTLAGDSAKIDKDGGNIIYTADMQGQQRVQQYLNQLRHGRPLIVMQMYIWEVRLNDASQAGIRFDASSLSNINAGNTQITPLAGINGLAGAADPTVANSLKSAAVSGAVSVGAVFKGAIDAGAVLSFLQTQGTVETVSNPQMTFVSGTKAEFSVGGKQNYISGVGQLVGTTNVTGGTANNTGVGTNTVQTDQIETGISVKVDGSYEGGVVFGDLSIEDVTLLGFDNVPSGGTTIQLPRTQERKLATVIRLRPGDTLLLAGLRSTNDDHSLNGLPTGLFGLLPFNGNYQNENREMVIMLRPAIIRFVDATDEDKVAPVARASNSPTADATLSRGDAAPQAATAPASPSAALDTSGRVSASGLQRAFQDMNSPASGPTSLMRQ